MEKLEVKQVPLAAVEYVNIYPQQDLLHINVRKADLPRGISPIMRGEIVAVEIRGIKLRAAISSSTVRKGSLLLMGNMLR